MQAAVVALAAWSLDETTPKRAPRPFVLAACERKIADVSVVAHEESPPLRHVAAGRELPATSNDVRDVDASTDDRTAGRKKYLPVVIVCAWFQALDLSWLEIADLRRALRRYTSAQIGALLNMGGHT